MEQIRIDLSGLDDAGMLTLLAKTCTEQSGRADVVLSGRDADHLIHYTNNLGCPIVVGPSASHRALLDDKCQTPNVDEWTWMLMAELRMFCAALEPDVDENWIWRLSEIQSHIFQTGVPILRHKLVKWGADVNSYLQQYRDLERVLDRERASLLETAIEATSVTDLDERLSKVWELVA